MRSSYPTGLILPLWIVLCFLAVAPTLAQSESSDDTAYAPYIYYYSHALNGIVVERADGSDSRILGQGLAEEPKNQVYGPGWSPDGQWFAWRFDGSWTGIGKGYAINIDGQTSLRLLEAIPCVHGIQWHPARNILLVYGWQEIRDSGDCPKIPYPIYTYWIIDADAQTLLATFSLENTLEWQSTPPVVWSTDQIQTYDAALISADEYLLQYFLITISFDGTVVMQPDTQANLDERFDEESGLMHGDGDIPESFFVRWSVDRVPRTIDLPSHSSAAGDAVGEQWDESHEWVFVGYELCAAGCSEVIGPVSVYHPATGFIREISSCLSHPACVGWLPERVNVANLPTGEPTSVLTTPISLDFERKGFRRDYAYAVLSHIAPHEMICGDRGMQAQSTIREIASGEIVFVLPDDRLCSKSDGTNLPSTRPVIFALSPDEQYFAITDESGFTSLYDAKTGEHIATLNFLGLELLFSNDGQLLIADSRRATARWDIQDLVAKAQRR